MELNLKLLFGDSRSPLQYSGVGVTLQISHRGQNGEILADTYALILLRKHFRAKGPLMRGNPLRMLLRSFW